MAVAVFHSSGKMLNKFKLLSSQCINLSTDLTDFSALQEAKTALHFWSSSMYLTFLLDSCMSANCFRNSLRLKIGVSKKHQGVFVTPYSRV